MEWNIYTLTSENKNLNGVKLRGRIRKFGIVNDITILAENTEDIENAVRIALLSSEADKQIFDVKNFLESIIEDIKISPELAPTKNPILSKLKCNDESRYSI